MAGEKDALACKCGALKLKRGACGEGPGIVKCPTTGFPRFIGLYQDPRMRKMVRVLSKSNGLGSAKTVFTEVRCACQRTPCLAP
jgi:hypothetical protein